MRATGTALLALLAIAGLAAPAAAAPRPTTRLVRCGDDTCLRISGRRDDPAAAVSINGQAVRAEGGRRWHVRLPIEQVRRWSSPSARTIAVGLVDARTQTAAIAEADLPIGLLGDRIDLASLVVSAR